jgi:uncharacterized protein (TIGR02001 family)
MSRSSYYALALVAGLAGATPALAADDGPFAVTGGVGFFSDYLYRGISQTDNDPAVQGSLEASYAFSGAFQLYLNVWGSNVDFADASVEIDVTPGLRGKVFGGLMYDVNVIYYWYPGARNSQDFEFYEPGGSLAYDFGFAVPKVGLRWSPEFFADSGDAYYAHGDLAVPLSFFDGTVGGKPFTIGLFGHVGHQWISHNATFGAPDYLDWNAGVSIGLYGLTVNLGYYDTDLSKSQCFSGANICEGRFLGSVGATF